MTKKCKRKVTLRYRLQRCLLTFFGDIKLSGWRPMWFTVNAHGYKIKGKHFRAANKLIRPGDILLRTFDGYLSSKVIPGVWKHAGIYIGDDQVIHALSEGVIQEDVLDFIMRTDHVMVLRMSSKRFPGTAGRTIERAKSILGKPYDFGFDFRNTDRFSCTELVDYCYSDDAFSHGLVEPKKRLGKKVIIADDFAACRKLTVIWDSRNVHATDDKRE